MYCPHTQIWSVRQYHYHGINDICIIVSWWEMFWNIAWRVPAAFLHCVVLLISSCEPHVTFRMSHSHVSPPTSFLKKYARKSWHIRWVIWSVPLENQCGTCNENNVGYSHGHGAQCGNVPWIIFLILHTTDQVLGCWFRLLLFSEHCGHGLVVEGLSGLRILRVMPSGVLYSWWQG